MSSTSTGDANVSVSDISSGLIDLESDTTETSVLESDRQNTSLTSDDGVSAGILNHPQQNKPPSLTQTSNRKISDRLDFASADGDKMSSAKQSNQESGKRKCPFEVSDEEEGELEEGEIASDSEPEVEPPQKVQKLSDVFREESLKEKAPSRSSKADVPPPVKTRRVSSPNWDETAPNYGRVRRDSSPYKGHRDKDRFTSPYEKERDRFGSPSSSERDRFSSPSERDRGTFTSPHSSERDRFSSPYNEERDRERHAYSGSRDKTRSHSHHSRGAHEHNRRHSKEDYNSGKSTHSRKHSSDDKRAHRRESRLEESTSRRTSHTREGHISEVSSHHENRRKSNSGDSSKHAKPCSKETSGFASHGDSKRKSNLGDNSKSDQSGSKHLSERSTHRDSSKLTRQSSQNASERSSQVDSCRKSTSVDRSKTYLLNSTGLSDKPDQQSHKDTSYSKGNSSSNERSTSNNSAISKKVTVKVNVDTLKVTPKHGVQQSSKPSKVTEVSKISTEESKDASNVVKETKEPSSVSSSSNRKTVVVKVGTVSVKETPAIKVGSKTSVSSHGSKPSQEISHDKKEANKKGSTKGKALNVPPKCEDINVSLTVIGANGAKAKKGTPVGGITAETVSSVDVESKPDIFNTKSKDYKRRQLAADEMSKKSHQQHSKISVGNGVSKDSKQKSKEQSKVSLEKDQSVKDSKQKSSEVSKKDKDKVPSQKKDSKVTIETEKVKSQKVSEVDMATKEEAPEINVTTETVDADINISRKRTTKDTTQELFEVNVGTKEKPSEVKQASKKSASQTNLKSSLTKKSSQSVYEKSLNVGKGASTSKPVESKNKELDLKTSVEAQKSTEQESIKSTEITEMSTEMSFRVSPLSKQGTDEISMNLKEGTSGTKSSIGSSELLKGTRDSKETLPAVVSDSRKKSKSSNRSKKKPSRKGSKSGKRAESECVVDSESKDGVHVGSRKDSSVGGAEGSDMGLDHDKGRKSVDIVSFSVGPESSSNVFEVGPDSFDIGLEGGHSEVKDVMVNVDGRSYYLVGETGQGSVEIMEEKLKMVVDSAEGHENLEITGNQDKEQDSKLQSESQDTVDEAGDQIKSQGMQDQSEGQNIADRGDKGQNQSTDQNWEEGEVQSTTDLDYIEDWITTDQDGGQSTAEQDEDDGQSIEGLYEDLEDGDQDQIESTVDQEEEQGDGHSILVDQDEDEGVEDQDDDEGEGQSIDEDQGEGQSIDEEQGEVQSIEDQDDVQSTAGQEEDGEGQNNEEQDETESQDDRNSLQVDLQEFEILDDLDQERGDDYPMWDSDADVDDNEVYAMLDEDYEKKAAEIDEENQYTVEEKTVLKDMDQHDPFNVLPDGWVRITHESGMYVYLHKPTRVCTMSRPYFIGPGSARKHEIPLSAIPCLQYKMEFGKSKTETENTCPRPDDTETCPESENVTSGKDTVHTSNKEEGMSEEPAGNINSNELNLDSEKQTDAKPRQDQDTSQLNGTVENVQSDSKMDVDEENKVTQPGRSFQGKTTEGGTVLDPEVEKLKDSIKVQSVAEKRKEFYVGTQELRKYCERLFEFKTIKFKRFVTWKKKRRYFKKKARPILPPSTTLITCPIQYPDDELENEMQPTKTKKKTFVLNPAGKSHLCILHEWAQHVIRVQPTYKFRELENAQTPFSCTVMIKDIAYGTGKASSKKLAKTEAAKASLRVLIPELMKMEEEKKNDQDHAFFDDVKIEDPRVAELCNRAAIPTPYQVLLECLKRNFGMGDASCKMNKKVLKHQRSEFTMEVGKHTVSVICKNKREGKQLVAQAMLQKLHPHVTSWGSIMRLYGDCSSKGFHERKEDKSVTELQANSNKANNAILERLKEQMRRLQKEKDAIKSKGKLFVRSANLPESLAKIDI